MNSRQLRALYKKIWQLELKLERVNLSGFVELLQNPARLIWGNFLAGVARGFGIAVGLTLITGVFLLIIGKVASLNLPLISEFLAELIRLIEEELKYLKTS